MPRFLSIGECMVELSDAGNGLLRRGFAGDTCNTAWYARHLLPRDWTVSYLTAAGNDVMSREMLAFMTGAGIDTSPVRILADRSPGLYLITVNNGERSFTYWRDTSAARLLADDPEHLRQHCTAADVIHFSGITLGILTVNAAQNLFNALGEARARGAEVSFDNNYRPRLWRGRTDAGKLFAEAARLSTIVFPGLEDEETVFGSCTADGVAQRYLSAGAKLVVVKDGAHGAIVYDGTTRTPIPAATPRAVVDTSAAGDSFAAGFLARFVQGDAAADAARFGAEVAAEVVSQSGALVPLSPALLEAASA